MNDNELTVRDFIAAWSRLDAAELASYFADDGCYWNMPAQPVHGRQNIERMIRSFVAIWTETHWDIRTLLASGDRVVAERLDRTKATQGDVDLPCLGIFVMRDGMIVQWRDYFDLSTYRQALKPPLRPAA
ncbi:MAG: nuclear transport factor 2 family protein [Betaproteobacteria bacterium]|jgi:limonene-1,2-epoxide hydrolase|nr:nuclear transport factor 2 family protein [Betaproteobacteria bacterium]MBK8107089.1 nuclear transport factor 2 family protein [Betaproteobacteria bacterium]